MTSISNYHAINRIDPLLKWPGGKAGELKIILPSLPPEINRFFEPFLGGGAVFFALSDTVPSIVNDKSDNLIEFYKCVSRGDEDFFSMLESIRLTWQALEGFVVSQQNQMVKIYLDYARKQTEKNKLNQQIEDFIETNRRELRTLFVPAYYYDVENLFVEIRKNLISKIDRMMRIEQNRGELPAEDILDNIEGALKSSFYMHLRHLFNYPDRYQITPSRQSALFYFIREYAYASMFRFNADGKFNVPYGGIGYNRKDMLKKIDKLKSSSVKTKLASAKLECMDFMDFFAKHNPQSGDFIFLDPPYDSDFSDYDKNSFRIDDQVRLSDFLIKSCKANFMLVIKKTDFILSLYDGHGLIIRAFDKKYSWTIKERNDRDVIHLMITNY